MLDTGFHQGAGLHSLTPLSELRLLAVASQDNAASGLDTLWQACAILQRMGYPVVVLDGFTQESDESPGLQHLLQQAPWHEGISLGMGATAPALAVIPSAAGLLQLQEHACGSGLAPLPGLLDCFRSHGLLVLHAPAHTLAAVLPPLDAITPVVVMGQGADGMLDTYRALKQITLRTGLPCMVANLLRGHGAAERHHAQAALQALQDCAMRHLGGPVRTTTIATQNPQDLQRLALQLLENAGTIGESLTALHPGNLAGLPAQAARSH